MTNVLDIAAAHAARYLETQPSRPILPTATVEELRQRVAKPLADSGMPPDQVIESPGLRRESPAQ